jgi:bacterioferritin (cytochrome b1)
VPDGGRRRDLMKKLARHNKAMVVNVLSERLEFERNGVKLYDTIIEKMERSGEDRIERMLGQMREHRDEEQEHAEWLAAQIRSLGGNPSKNSELADLAARESKGIEEVVTQDEELPHLFHALLGAELVDAAGWDLLIELAEEAEDDEALSELEARKDEEDEHLEFVKRAVLAFSSEMVLGREMEMPSGP